jgi:Flp pilus assembly protein CpaB
VAAVLSLLAGAALLVFLREYRDNLTSTDRVRVVVARSLIPKGTPGEVVLEKRLYKVVRVEQGELADGAVIDPDVLKKRAAADDVFPGHQLTEDDFGVADGTIRSRLSEYQRAMTVPVDKAHGMIGEIEAGDRVDVITTDDGGIGILSAAQVAARNALVLAVPEEGGGGVTARQEPVSIRVSDRAAATIAAAADGGKVWLVLRPPVGARMHSGDAFINGVRKGKPLEAEVDINATVRER